MKKKNFLVIGLGRFGSMVAKTLESLKCDVLAVDNDEDIVSSISNCVSHCVIADSTKLKVLTDLNAASFDHAVVAIGNNLQASILTVLNLKKLGVKNITVRADNEDFKEVFENLGVTEVIIPEEVSAISLANQITSNSILDYYYISDEYGMYKVSVGQNFASKSLIELDVRNIFDVNIVGIIRDDLFYIPKGTDVLNALDVVVVVGKKNKIKKFDLFLNA